MEVIWVVLFIIYAIVESAAKAQKRAAQQAAERERQVRQAGGRLGAPQQAAPQQARPQQYGPRQARPVRRTPVTWREPGQQWPPAQSAGRPAGMAPAPAATATGPGPDDLYAGSMGHLSTEGLGLEGLNSEWDIPGDQPDWDTDRDDPEIAGYLPFRSTEDPATMAVRMLSGLDGATVATGAATAIVLTEVLGQPRAHRPWRRRRTGSTMR